MGQVLSTVTTVVRGLIAPFDRWLKDAALGHIVGIANPNAGGKDTYIYPIQLTQAQIDAPTADMIADTDVTYALNVAPWTRYYSNGTMLIAFANEGGGGSLGVPTSLTTGNYDIPAGFVLSVTGPFTVQAPAELTIEGTLKIN